MKKVLLTMVAALSISVASYATNEKNAANWDFQMNANQLRNYLQLSSYQMSEVSNICDYFSEQMKSVSYSKKNQKEKLQKTVYGNLKLMKQTLTNDQYKKYVRLLNVTMQNKGLEL